MVPSLRMGAENKMSDHPQFPEVNKRTVPSTLSAVREHPSWKERIFNRVSTEGESKPSSVVESLKSFLPSIASLPKWRRTKSFDIPKRWTRGSMKPTPPPAESGTSDTNNKAFKDPRKARLQKETTRSAEVEEHEPSERKERSISLPDAFHAPRRVREPKLHVLIPGKLSLALNADEAQTRELIQSRPDLFVFSSVLHEAKNSRAFGTVNIGTVHSFWKHVVSKATHPRLNGRPLVYYSDFGEANKANAALLLGCYMMLEHGLSAAQAAARLEVVGPLQLPHCAASKVPRSSMTVEDYLRGLEKAVAAGWFDKERFDAIDFEWLLLSGDMSVLCPKFLAFRGPTDTDLTASFYASKLRARGVEAVVRLNEANTYYAEHFEDKGICHHQLFFRDGSNPSPETVQSFLQICDATEGSLGVHCLAGLGRTGTLVCLWMMRRAGFSAKEAIAWVRLVRPGSVMGQQQAFLLLCDTAEWEGDLLPLAAQQLHDTPATVLQLGRSSAPPRAAAEASSAKPRRILVGAARLRAGRDGVVAAAAPRYPRSW